MRRMVGGWCVLVLLVLCGAAPPAAAHLTLLSSGRVAVDGDTVTGEVRLNRHDLEAMLGSAAPVAAILAFVTRGVGVRAAGEACAAEPGDIGRDEEFLTVRLVWRCPPGAAPLSYRATLFHEAEPTARHVLLVAGAAGEHQALLDAAAPEIELDRADESVAATARRYLLAGVEHIFLGYDHIAFLLAVILWGRRLLPLVKVVTSFTVAHSLTLSLAALGIVELPAAVVEPAIAASIVFVATENFFVRDIAHRWRVTFLLGLVHGFGFAGALGELGLPKGALAVGLASFNAGVELGQIAILAVALPLLLAAERLVAPAARTVAPRAGLVYALSTVIAGLGVWWFIDRTLLA